MMEKIIAKLHDYINIINQKCLPYCRTVSVKLPPFLKKLPGNPFHKYPIWMVNIIVGPVVICTLWGKGQPLTCDAAKLTAVIGYIGAIFAALKYKSDRFN